jgi:hypothetical protein
VPIIPQQAVSADRPSTGLIEPIIDGVTSEGEWDAAGLYQASGGVMAKAQPFFDSLTYGFDSKNLYLRLALVEELSFPSGDSYVGIYLDAPGSGASNSFSHNGSILGFPANRLLEMQFTNGSLAEAVFYVATANEEWITNSSFKIGGPGLLELSINDPAAELTTPLAYNEGQLELAIPLSALGNADTGDRLTMRALYSETLESEGGSVVVDVDQVPEAGPVLVAVPDLGTTTILVDIVDPSNDDHGPGNYSYPTDAVFNSGNFDLLNFQMGYDVENIVFKFTMRGPVDNSWGSPNGLSVQTFDVYIDLDGDGEGGIAMLPGRNLSLQEGNAWDLAITAEGWTPGIYTPGEGGPQQIAGPSEFLIMADPGQRKVAIRVPRSFFSTDPEDWRLAAVVLSQDGYNGVMRVRDVLPVAEQWRIGGAPLNVSNHTRVMDLVWPVEGEQEAWMSDFINSDLAQAELTADAFAKVPMFAVGE